MEVSYNIIESRNLAPLNNHSEQAVDQSAPINGVEQLRTLIGSGTARRGNEMLSLFESMLRGRSVNQELCDNGRFRK